MNVSPDPSFERERELFLEAAAKSSPSERAAFLDRACGDDRGLRRRLEALLRHPGENDFLEKPAVDAQPTQLTGGAQEEKPGAVIGRYRLLQQIGEGGCGVVYMAQQEVPVRRRVALKIIKLGMDTKAVIARFAAERQVLALLDHPNIAKVFDAGATDTGRPYFVMELVPGVKITEFCEQHHLPARDRLQLAIQVCEAIQHAHNRGIVHRDIKPSNILVSLRDGRPVPVVIDFGIAKATELRLTDQTLFTGLDQFMGTPAYTSPEQAQSGQLDVDGRSDVYSLGVLLYELLTNGTPFDPKDLMKAGLDEMRRTIRETEPARPSTRLARARTGSRENSRACSRSFLDADKELIQLLRGDLDWIVMKCLEKDRARRYQAPKDLAADLENHLANRPVRARPPSVSYRFGKLLRRHRSQALTAALLGIVVLIAGSLHQREAARARQAEQLAREQAALAQSAQAFIQEELPQLYRLRMADPHSGPAATNVSTGSLAGQVQRPSFWQRIINNDGSITIAPQEVIERYLARNQTNAESLLGASQAAENRADWIKRAALQNPSNAPVLFAAVTLDLFPDERRTWIDRFKAAAPNDALPLYLSAQGYLKAGETERALEELRAASQRSELNDYRAERIQPVEEIYLEEGRSPAEAKAVAAAGLLLPHLKLLKELGSDLAVLQGQFIATGDSSTAEWITQAALRMARQLRSGSGADLFVNQKVGFEIERTMLQQLNPDAHFAWLEGTPGALVPQAEAGKAQAEAALARSDTLLSRAPEADVMAFFDRLKLYGEPAALRWLEQRVPVEQP